MANVSVSGVGSGIDVNGLVDQLVAAERDPKVERLDLKEATLQTQLSSFGLLKSALSDVQGALSRLGQESLYRERTASSSDEAVFGASAGPGAATGSYEIQVEKLATAHKLRSTGFEGGDALVGTGTLAIRAGEASFSIAVDETSNTLAGLRDAINAAPENTAVSASIVNVDDGAGGTESRLVLSARAEGSENAITVTATDDDGDDTDAAGLSRLAWDPDAGLANLVEVSAPEDAEVWVDGQQATRSTNAVSDLIEGVTLTLEKADPGVVHSVSVGESAQGAEAAVNEFVNAFNAFVESLNSTTSYDAETGQAGILLGDSTVRQMESRLRTALSDRVPGAAEGLNSLASLGIRTGDDGLLSVDSRRLSAALSDNAAGVEALFTGEDGLATRLDGVISGYVGTNGLLDTRTEGLNARIEDIGDQRVRLGERIEALEERLRSQFTAMDQLVAELQTTGNFLAEQLSTLGNNGNDK